MNAKSTLTGWSLMRARTELAFLLSDQVCTPASEVIEARERINELLNRIPMDGSRASSKCLDFAAMSTEKSGFDGPHLWQRAPFYTTTRS
jgi:hypothetical protein